MEQPGIENVRSNDVFYRTPFIFLNCGKSGYYKITGLMHYSILFDFTGHISSLLLQVDHDQWHVWYDRFIAQANQFYSGPVRYPINVESQECRFSEDRIQDSILESYKIPSTSYHMFSGQGLLHHSKLASALSAIL